MDNTEKKVLSSQLLADISASAQHVVSLQLEDRVARALKFLSIRNMNVNTLVVSGGVASNLYINSRLKSMCLKQNVATSCPPVSYCTDNGVMIAWNGCEKLVAKSLDFVGPAEQTKEFFDGLKPLARCDLGLDIRYQIELLNIRN